MMVSERKRMMIIIQHNYIIAKRKNILEDREYRKNVQRLKFFYLRYISYRSLIKNM